VDKEHGLSVKEAGARGGKATLARYGRDYYAAIGRLGGQRTAALYGLLFREFGKLGGRPRRPVLGKNMGEKHRK